MRRNKALQFSAPGYETPSIPFKNPEGVKEGKRKQEVKRNSQEHEAVVRVQSEKIRILVTKYLIFLQAVRDF